MMSKPCRAFSRMGETHPDRCHWADCPQGSAHHPHDWMREVDDDQPDWHEYLSEQSARERESLYCGVCHEGWPCATKREHVTARAVTERGGE